MKKFILLLIISTAILTAQNETVVWDYLYQPNTGYVRGLRKSDNGDLYAFCKNGVFKSTNNGDFWKHIFKKRTYEFELLGDSILAAVCYDKSYCIYISQDKGLSWDLLKKPFPEEIDYKVINFKKDGTLLIMPTRDNQLNNNLHLYMSNDYGKNWYRSRDSLVSEKGIGIYCIYVDENDVIYLAGELQDNKPKGVFFKTTDNGNSWSQSGLINSDCNISKLLSLNEETLLAGTINGLFISRDSGKTWQGTQFVENIRDIYYKDGVIYIYAVNNGFFISKDSGIKWEKVYDGFIENFLVINNEVMFGSNENGIYKSHDNGKNWVHTSKGFTSCTIEDIKFLRNRVYIAYQDLFISEDNAASWIMKEKEYFGNTECLIIPNNNIIIASGKSWPVGIIRSTDGGDNWYHVLPNGTDGAKEFIFDNEGNILAAGMRRGVIKSTDDGETWVSLNSKYAECIAINSEGQIFHGEAQFSWQLYQTTNNGNSWHNVLNKTETIVSIRNQDLLFHKNKPLGFYATEGWGSAYNVYRTTDNGMTWHSIKENMNKLEGELAVDSAGNFWNGPYRTTDNGEKWVKQDSGLFHDSFTAIAVSPDGYIYLAAKYGGLYRSREPVVSVEEAPEQPAPASGTALEARPNPCTESAAIHYALSTPGTVRLSLYNLLGMEAASWDEGLQPPGAHTLTIDTSPLPPGAYLLRLEAGSHRQSVMVVRE